ncbi:hypothetical protein BJX62DRAFT_169462 [Aspergillus germanicus]
MDQDTQDQDDASSFMSTSSQEDPEASLPLLSRPGLYSPKPALILLARAPHQLPKTYPSIISKLQRDAHLITIPTVSTSHNPIETLTTLLRNPTITPSIAGIVIADTSIMDAEDPCMVELTETLRDLIQTLPPRPHYSHQSHSITTNNNNNHPTTPTLLFAFDFPAQATHQPLLFHKYISTHFSIAWRICGATMGKVSLEIQESGLTKMGGRMYRGQGYSLRAVFLEGVQEEDKVLVVARGASIGNGGLGRSGQPGVEPLAIEDVEKHGQADQLTAGLLVGAWNQGGNAGNETDSTAGEEGEFEVSRVEVGEGTDWTVARPRFDEHGEAYDLTGLEHEDTSMAEPEHCWHEYDWADDELTSTTDLDSDEEASSSSSSDDTDSDNDNTGIHSNNGQPGKRVIYINAPSHRRTSTISSSSSSSSNEANDPTNPNPQPTLQPDPKYPQKKHKPSRLANCPVAIHELQSSTTIQQGSKRVRVRGFVGFVGHVEDNRSMASLMLGICAVRNTRPLPEGVRRDLGVYFG